MAKLTPKEFQEKHARNLKASVTDILKGIDKVSEAPGKKAAEKKAKWIARMTDPAVHAKWAANVGAVTLEEWKAAAKELIPSRLPAGIDKAAPKVEDFAGKLLAYQDAHLAEVHKMPDLTATDMKARMTKWFDLMSAFKYKK